MSNRPPEEFQTEDNAGRRPDGTKARAPREKTNVRVSFKKGGGYPSSKADLQNISRTGFLLETTAGFATGGLIWLHLDGISALDATVVWTDNFFVGARFNRPLPDYIFDSILKDLC